MPMDRSARTDMLAHLLGSAIGLAIVAAVALLLGLP
jgi:hypothetical protein